MNRKKQDTVLVSITSRNINRFQNSFNARLGTKFSTKLPLHIPPHLKGIAALPSDTVMFQLLASSGANIIRSAAATLSVAASIFLQFLQQCVKLAFHPVSHRQFC